MYLITVWEPGSLVHVVRDIISECYHSPDDALSTGTQILLVHPQHVCLMGAYSLRIKDALQAG